MPRFTRFGKRFPCFQDGIQELLEIPLVSKAFNQYTDAFNKFYNTRTFLTSPVEYSIVLTFATLVDKSGVLDVEIMGSNSYFKFENEDFYLAWFPRIDGEVGYKFTFAPKGCSDKQAIEAILVTKGWNVD